MEINMTESAKDLDDPLLRTSTTLGFSITNQQQQQVDQLVKSTNIQDLTPSDIVQIGFSAEQALQKTLDGFLLKLDRSTSVQVFDLFDRLEKGVNDANLPEVLKKIEQTKPSIFARIMGFLKGKSASQVTREAFESIKDLISGKTQTLAFEVGKIEKDLAGSMHKLNTELQTLDELKEWYHSHLENFGTVAVASQLILEKSQAFLTEMELENRGATKDNPILQARLYDLRQKVQLLESRTLSLVGAYTRLPADHIIIQQIEQAGVATLQETAITASSRFASIKTTLLAINGAFNVKHVQQLVNKHADMDRQLQQVRSQLTREIVTSAIASPGENRLEQAAQIEKIIVEAKEIRNLMKTAQDINEQKFLTARERFAALRNQLSENE